MTQQTEAQRLADWCRTWNTTVHNQVEAELRRMEAELERKSDAIQRLWKERDDLRAANAQLLKALEDIASTDPVDAALDPDKAQRIASAAIKAAKGGA